jgi:hypothetical protein
MGKGKGKGSAGKGGKGFQSAGKGSAFQPAGKGKGKGANQGKPSMAWTEYQMPTMAVPKPEPNCAVCEKAGRLARHDASKCNFANPPKGAGGV